ncbi:uncharacterized protein lrrc66 isoform X2 [Mastacembelus armatus]|uniref:uncharacterized protein lrrc66 isoform X2 n=1 Tax=Mastacembelus armatus TaxID=205130 RepID=UPI000E457048|nr:leucine-rich repeat-containing protein 66 isoform X2 [Mastacembelus armatus]
MAVARGPSLAAVLLLVSLGLHCSSPASACPESCTCQRATVLNCSSSNLFLVPQPIQDSVTELDLSNNLLNSVTLHLPHHNLRGVWLGSNTITHLSLCIGRNLGRPSVRDGRLHRSRPWSRRGCVSWAPTLQMLSVERNQLQQLPEGLEGSESLEVLQLSFNRISSLRPQDLSHLRQLKELDLRHNLITSLHPQMFQDLAQLRVLDLSFNKLTSIHPLMYHSLHNIGTDVRLGGNRWQCDCSIRSLRRRMAYDSSRGLQTWSVLCASPSILSGKDLLQLEEDDLNCFSTENKPELHRDVTVYSGSDILLSCSTQDSTWWMPSGQGSMSQSHAGLLISDVKERDTGLYVCVSEEREVVSVFNLQISKIGGARRNPRSLPRTHRQIIPQDFPNRISQERNQPAAQSDLTLAVCLSVFITFMIAFILGVLARPCIDVLWRRVTKKKSSSATDSASSIEKRQYDNQAYCSGEELGEVVTHRERRVTFSTIEDINVQYYDTIVRDDQENTNNDAVFESEADEAKDKHTAGNSRSDNALQQSAPEVNLKDGRENSDGADADCTHNMKFEPILDPAELEERGSLSSCSDSSLSDRVLHKEKMTKGERTIPRSSQLSEDSVQQNAEVVPQFFLEDRSEIPGFSSEPFADWSPHTNKINPADTDLWQENEEKFEFSDSVRSSSLSGSFNDSKQIVARTLGEKKQGDISSSSSYVSEDEPTQYTVNSDQEEEERYRGDIEKNHEISEVMKQKAIFKQQVHGSSMEFNQSDYKHDTQTSLVTQKHSFSSHSSDSDGEPMHSKVKQKTDKGQGKEELKYEYDKLSSRIVTAEGGTRDKVNLGFEQSTPIKRHLHIKTLSPASDSSSGSDSEKKHHAKKMPEKMDIAGLPFQQSLTVSPNSETWFPALDLEHIPHLERRLDIKVLSTLPDSSSSNDSENEITEHIKKSEQWATYIPRHLDIKPPSSDSSNSSSSCDSEDETSNCVKKQEQGEINMARLPIKSSQTISPDPEAPWPALNLEHVPQIKRRLDIKAPSPPPDSSSSSDSEDETTGHTEEQRPGKVDSSGHLYQESPAASHDSGTTWPLLDLEHIPGIKRRLDIKAPSLPPDSSSSSDSEDETTNCVKKQEQGEINMVRLPIKSSETISPDPEAPWPVLNLEHVPHIKRRLDIKAPSPDSDSSPSSASEDETADHTQKPRPTTVDVTKVTLQKSQAVIHDPQARWPSLDLEHISHIKRRLDIKAPSPPPDSSSSSDSEDETTNCVKKQEQGEINMARLPIKSSQTISPDPEAPWPALNLEHVPHIKRRLDIKAPSPPPDSSSSSDSEDETTGHTEEQRPGKVDSSGHLYQESPAASHDSGTTWPLLDLEHIPGIKRRLDIKAPSPPPDSSSSSDSEDETTNCVKKQEQGEINMVRLPIKSSQTISPDPEAQWPALNLEHVPHIKRRLDIKAPSPPPDSSSSSDSEDETTGHTEEQRPGKVDSSGHLYQESPAASHDSGTTWPLLDLEHIPGIKRRLDIKAPSPPPDSSSSSDSEDETTNCVKKQEQGEINMARLPIKSSQTISPDPEAPWPALNLEHVPHIKRRLDIKAPSPPPDSSSSSDSEDETTGHTEEQRPGKVDSSGHLYQESPAASHDSGTTWPLLDLEHIPGIKRRLDIKAPSPPPDSSSSSDSEDETTNCVKKQEQGEINMARLPIKSSQTISPDPEAPWPALNLEHVPHIKRRLDIKAPSPDSDSSPSSASEDETADHTQKPRPTTVDVTKVTLQKSQAVIHDPQARWPSLDLEHISHIKRRLDIKAPSPPPDSSSSSDSEDETTNCVKKQEQGEINMARLPIKSSQTISPDPEAPWPALNLEHVPHIKRRLDIKAPSPPPDSSSSSDSEDETTGHTEEQRPGKVDSSGHLYQESPAASHDSGTTWPLLDLEHIPGIKRRLDIKAPSPPPDSSSSSDSEDETTNCVKKQEQGEINMARLPIKSSQTISPDPEAPWPALNLEHVPHIKRRLDIKAPSPPPDSSSSSDSEDETTGHTEEQRPGKVDSSGHLYQESPAASHDSGTTWPLLDLEHIPGIKRRLDIKAPSPPPDSSSSSDSEDETTNCVKKQEQGEINMVRLPIKSSQTISPDPEAQWPALNLEHVPHIKRRLDIKAPSPDSDSSPSSASEDETADHTQKPRPTTVDVTKVTLQKSQAVIHDPQARWPSLDLERISHIKRRLDIKAPSPPPDSSSSSDSEDETTNCVKKQEQGETQWPAVDLDKFTCIKRRLDVKAPSPPPDLLFSGGSRDHTVEGKKKEVYEIDSGLPKINLSNVPLVKRHLDIKVCSPSTGFSSSDESDSGTTDLPLKVEGMGITNYQPGTKLSDFSGVLSVPMVRRLLNIKAPDQRADSCSSNSDKENRPSSSTVKEGQKGEQQTKLHKLSLGIPQNNSRLDIKATLSEPHSPKTNSQIQLEKYTVITDDLRDKLINDEIINTPEINQELLSRWATMNLGVSRFRKRLKITSHTHEVPSLPSSPPPDSPSPPSSIEHAGKEWNVSSQLPVVTDKEVSQKRTSQSETEEVKKKDSMWPQPSLTNIPYVKRALDIRAPVQRESSSSSNSEDKTIEHIVPDLSLGIPRIKRRLNIKAPSPEPSDSASCSESENDVTRYTVKQSINKSVTSGMTDESQISYKRLIMKTSLPSSNSFSPSGHSQTADHAEMVTESQSHTAGRQNAYFSPVKIPNMSFDIVKKSLKQSRYTTDDNLPPEIRWTGVGRHLPDLSISGLGRQQGEGLSSPQQASPAQPELPHSDSSNFSSSRSHDRIKQFREKADGTVSLSAKSLSVASSRALDESLNSTGSTNEIFKAVSEQTRERKGLSALRAMSSERQKWDKDVDHLDKKISPLFDDHGPQDDRTFNNHMSEDITPLGKRPLTSVAKRRAGDLLYGIPHYRRHDFGDIEPPQEAPPPIPETPPPDEPVGFI